MPFFSHSTPNDKLQALARHLCNQIHELSLQRWGSYLNDATQFAAEGNPVGSRIEAICQTPAILRNKNDFSWETLMGQNSTGPSKFKFLNSKLQHEYYIELLNRALALESALDRPYPDYKTIYLSCLAIKNHPVTVPSVVSDKNIDIKFGYFTGGTIITNFLEGLAGMAGSLAALTYSLSFAIYLHCSGQNSGYFGTSSFHLDCLSWFVNSLYNVVSSILFPVAMLQSKYKTDSYNVVKGELTRTVDSMMAITKKLDPATISQLNLDENAEPAIDQIYRY